MRTALRRLAAAVFTAFLLTSSAYAQECLPGAGATNASLILPNTLVPTADGAPLTAVSTIRAYAPGGQCVGSTSWTPGAPAFINVAADDDQTPGEVEGMRPGETISYRVTTGGVEYQTATATYASGSGVFAYSAMMTMTGLAATNPAVPPTFSAAPNILDLGEHMVGATATGAVVVTNTGNQGALVISGVVSTSAMITVAPTTASIAAGAAQTFTVTYRPTAAGTHDANLNFTHNGAGGSSATVVVASAQAAQPGSLAANPTSLAYGAVAVGGSQWRDVTLTHSGGAAPLVISGVTLPAGYTASPTTASINSGSSATIRITFAPTQAGAANGDAVFTHNGAGGATAVALTGAAALPAFSAAPTTLDLGVRTVGATATGAVVVTNTGLGNLVISNVVSTNAMITVSPTTATIAAGGTRSFTVTYQPTAAGTHDANLNFTHNGAGGSSATVVVASAQAAQPGSLAANPTSLAYGAVLTGASSYKDVVLTHSGGAAPLVVSGITLPAGYSASPTTATLAPGANATIRITFAPTQAGAANGNAVFAHNGAGGSTTVALTGAGQTPQPGSLAAAPATLAYGSIVVGNSSYKDVTLTHSGGAAPLVVSGVTLPAGYTASPTTASIPVGGAATIRITFTPTQAGAANGNAVFAHNGTGGSTTVALTGAGQAAAAGALAVSPGALAFGAVVVGASPFREVTFTHNGGTAPLVVSGITAPEGYTVSPQTLTLAPGANATVRVTFTPAQAGAANGSLAIAHNGGGAASIALTGAAQASVPVTFAASPEALDFGVQAVGATAARTLVVTNSGNQGALVISGVASTGDMVTIAPTTANIAAGASQTFTVTYHPTTAGPHNATLSFAHNGAGGASTVAVAASAQAAAAGSLVANPASVSFGSVTLGASPYREVTLTHTGGSAPLVVTDIALPLDYTVSPQTLMLAPGASATLRFTYTPTQLGVSGGDARITHNGVGGLAVVELSGVGAQPAHFAAAPTRLSFGAVVLGADAATIVTVSNPGGARPLVVSDVASSHPAVSVAPRTATIAPGASVAFTVTLATHAEGAVEGMLRFEHNGSSGEGEVYFSASIGPVETATVDQTYLSFHDTYVGGVSEETVTMTHTGGSEPLVVTAAASDDAFSVAPATATIQPGAAQTFFLRFRPSAAGRRAGAVTLSHRLGQSTISVAGAGLALPTNVLAADRPAYDAGSVLSEQRRTVPMTLRNTDAARTLRVTEIASSDAAFQVSPATLTLAPGQSGALELTFHPTGAATGPRTAAITFRHDAGGELQVQAAGRVAGLLGDGNADGALDLLDVLMTRSTAISAEAKRALDVHPFPAGDGAVTPEDEAALISRVVHKRWGAPQAGGAAGGPAAEPEGAAAVVQGTAKNGAIGMQIEARVSGLTSAAELVQQSAGHNLRMAYGLADDGMLTMIAFRTDGMPLETGPLCMVTIARPGIRPDDVQVLRAFGASADFQRDAANANVQATANEPALMPVGYALSAPYPNPFNPQARFTLRMEQAQDVTISVFDALGRRVQTLHQGVLAAATHQFTLEGAGLTSGAYFIVARGAHFHQVQQAILLK